jgi:hypothetical protein
MTGHPSFPRVAVLKVHAAQRAIKQKQLDNRKGKDGNRPTHRSDKSELEEGDFSGSADELLNFSSLSALSGTPNVP